MAAVLAAKAGGVAVGAVLAAIASPALPTRLAVLLTLALPAAGFVAPEALLERAARRRRARIGSGAPRRPGPARGRDRRRAQPGDGSRGDLRPRKRAAGRRAGGRGGRDRVRGAAARGDRRGSRTRARRRARGLGVGARALPALRLAARRAAPRAGGVASPADPATDLRARGPGGAEDPAGGGPGPRPLGPSDDPRRPGGSLGRPARRRSRAPLAATRLADRRPAEGTRAPADGGARNGFNKPISRRKPGG